MLMYFNLADIDIHYQIERFEIMYPSYYMHQVLRARFRRQKKLLVEYHGSSVTRTRDRSKNRIF